MSGMIGKYFEVEKRLSGGKKTPLIIKISGFGNVVPQRVYGKLFNRKTGEIINAENDKEEHYPWEEKGKVVFVCEIDKSLYPEGIPMEIMDSIKKEVIEKIKIF